MSHDFVDDVLDSRFVAVAELIPTGSNLFELVFQKLDEIVVFIGAHKRDGADESVSTHPSLCKGVGKFRQALIELLGGLMNGMGAGVQMNAMGDIPRQKEESQEVCGFHTGNDTPRQRTQSIALHKGVAPYIGGV